MVTDFAFDEHREPFMKKIFGVTFCVSFINHGLILIHIFQKGTRSQIITFCVIISLLIPVNECKKY